MCICICIYINMYIYIYIYIYSVNETLLAAKLHAAALAADPMHGKYFVTIQVRSLNNENALRVA